MQWELRRGKGWNRRLEVRRGGRRREERGAQETTGMRRMAGGWPGGEDREKNGNGESWRSEGIANAGEVW